MRSHGFTLVELLVTVAIVGVLAALAAPGMTRFLSKRSVASASSNVASDMRFARAEAVKRSQKVTMCRSTDGASCSGTGNWADGWIVFQDTDGSASVDSGDTILRVQQALTGISTLQNPTVASTRAAFTYESTGIALSASDSWVVIPTGSVPTLGTQLICISNQGRPGVRAAGTALPC